jgi:uncharacterized protein with FMN-binding domain
MKRAILVGGGTLAGVAAVLALNPDAASTSTASAATSVSSGAKAGSSSGGKTPGSTAAPSSPASSGSSATDGTYPGDAVDVGRGYGTVQVEITVTGGRIVDVQALAVPQNDPRSAQISNVAVPYLVDQALQAQSSSIAGVSGASYTSAGFAESLKTALVAAGLA